MRARRFARRLHDDCMPAASGLCVPSALHVRAQFEGSTLVMLVNRQTRMAIEAYAKGEGAATARVLSVIRLGGVDAVLMTT